MSAKETRSLLKAARKAGAVVEMSGAGHWRVTNPATGMSVTMSSSPSDCFATHKQRRDLRSIGITV